MNSVLETFILMFIGEIGDKTQFTTLVLSAKYGKLKAFAGSMGALLTASILEIWIGYMITLYLPSNILKTFVGILFIIFGILFLLSKDREEKEKIKDFSLAALFTLVFLAEMGDKTQFTLIALASKYSDPLGVLTGATLAFAAVNGLSALVGEKISDRMPTRTIRIVSAIIFTLSGILTLFSNI